MGGASGRDDGALEDVSCNATLSVFSRAYKSGVTAAGGTEYVRSDSEGKKLARDLGAAHGSFSTEPQSPQPIPTPGDHSSELLKILDPELGDKALITSVAVEREKDKRRDIQREREKERETERERKRER